MATKTLELNYTPELNRKIIHKAGVPGDNLPDNLMQCLCKYQYENDNIIEGKRILVIRMLDLAKYYAVKNSVTYITDNPEKYDEFLKVINNEQKYGGDDSVELIEDWKNIGEIVKDMPKFDVIIGNPPYTKGGKSTKPLYAEIACKIFKSTKKMIWICPTSWTHKIEYDVSKEKYRKELENYFVSCDLVEPELLGISITDKLGIYVLDESNNKNAPFEEWKFYNCKNPSLTKSILNKVKEYSKDNLQNHYHKKEGKFIVQAAQCRGHVGKWDWTTFFDEKNKKMILNDFDKITNDRYNWWTFETKSECEVFKNYTETDIFMFILYSYKTGLPQPLTKLPWIESYKNDIDDKYLTNYFHLTQEEVDYIHEEMKNYGWKSAPKKKSK